MSMPPPGLPDPDRRYDYWGDDHRLPVAVTFGFKFITWAFISDVILITPMKWRYQRVPTGKMLCVVSFESEAAVAMVMLAIGGRKYPEGTINCVSFLKDIENEKVSNS